MKCCAHKIRISSPFKCIFLHLSPHPKRHSPRCITEHRAHHCQLASFSNRPLFDTRRVKSIGKIKMGRHSPLKPLPRNAMCPVLKWCSTSPLREAKQISAGPTVSQIRAGNGLKTSEMIHSGVALLRPVVLATRAVRRKPSFGIT